MSEQLSTSRRTVALATVVLILTIAAFGASFYYLDGATVAVDTYESLSALVTGLLEGETTPAPVTTTPEELILPDGMSEEFALRLWQEQIDSQEMIGRLVEGEVASLKIDKVTRSGSDTRLTVTVELKDGTNMTGTIGLRRVGDVDYVAYIASDPSRVPPKGGLPTLEEVDVALLNTMLSQNAQSQPVIDEYIDGTVKQVNLGQPALGPRTATLDIKMDETHGEGYARLVVVQSSVDGQDKWFITRFKKTGHNPPNL